MTLATSGTISIGGSTANRSINIELDRSATATSSLGETALRTLAGVSSGAISLSNFYGKSHILDTQTVTVGQQSNNYYGYMSLSIGSITDGTCNFKNNATIERIVWVQGVPAYNLPDKVFFMLYGNHSNSDFDTMTIAGTDFERTDATFSYISYSNLTSWEWAVTANPFGTSVGATKTVTWT